MRNDHFLRNVQDEQPEPQQESFSALQWCALVASGLALGGLAVLLYDTLSGCALCG
jgi:hypothetical protein